MKDEKSRPESNPTKRMAKRSNAPYSAVEEVLIQCRRRCCFCFRLMGDMEIKKGQIAHLDQDPGNNESDNMAFLCFDHHDEYDSQTRQSKGLTEREAKRYRADLYAVQEITLSGN